MLSMDDADDSADPARRGVGRLVIPEREAEAERQRRAVGKLQIPGTFSSSGIRHGEGHINIGSTGGSSDAKHRGFPSKRDDGPIDVEANMASSPLLSRNPLESNEDDGVTHVDMDQAWEDELAKREGRAPRDVGKLKFDGFHREVQVKDPRNVGKLQFEGFHHDEYSKDPRNVGKLDESRLKLTSSASAAVQERKVDRPDRDAFMQARLRFEAAKKASSDTKTPPPPSSRAKGAMSAAGKAMSNARKSITSNMGWKGAKSTSATSDGPPPPAQSGALVVTGGNDDTSSLVELEDDNVPSDLDRIVPSTGVAKSPHTADTNMSEML